MILKSVRLVVVAAALALLTGASQRHVFEYEKPDRTPIVFSAESKATGAYAGEYCLWLDVYYTDGTATWGMGDACAPCRQGTHDWEKTVGVFRPNKPVKKIEYYALFRHGRRGKVTYRNVRLERREPRENEPTKIVLSDFPRTRSAADAQRGPSTVAPTAFAVWTADSMEKITPCTYPTADRLAAPPRMTIEMMRHERESAQICVTAGTACELTAARIELSALRNKAGRRLKGTVQWQRIGYVPRLDGIAPHPYGAPPDEKWLPDPLLPAAPFRVRAGSTQGVWLTVYAAPEAEPGTYAGTVAVVAQGGKRTTVPLTVAVREKTLPKTFSTWNSFSVMDGFTRLRYPERFKEMKRKSWDIMLDHRLSPDDISRFTPPEIDDLLYARERGMNLFNILNIVPEPADPNTPIVYTTNKKTLFSDWFYPSFRDRLVPYVKELKRHGLEKMAYIYGFDEQEKEYYPAIDLFWRNLRRDVPGIPLMSTSRAYRDLADGVTNLTETARSGDWFCPLTSHWKPELSKELQKEGRKVWWYTCCGPVAPYMNFVSLEFPFIEGRLMGWQTHLYRADGFLFWVVNFWSKNQPLLDESDTYLAWDSRISNRQYGDGVLLYPGRKNILPSIRLANVRDGIEDGELLKMVGERDAAAADAACRKLIESRTKFTREAALVRRVRAELLK